MTNHAFPDRGSGSARRIALALGLLVTALAVVGSLEFARGPDGETPASDGAGPDVPTSSTGLLRVRTSPAVPSTVLVDDVPRDDWALNWMKVDPGRHVVGFSDVPGYTTPSPITVDVAADGVTEVVGRFQRRGFLRVVTEPAVPATISVDGVPRDDWGLWASMEAGSYVLSFGPVEGYRPPSPMTVEVRAGETTVAMGTYVFDGVSPGPDPRTYGWLRVATEPAVPSQVLVDDVPRDDWALNWLKLEPGLHVVEFTDVPGFGTPAAQGADIVAGETTIVLGGFQTFGSLRITTSPALPSTIYLDGVPVDDWGAWTSVPPGAHRVSFGSIPGYAVPAPVDVAVVAGSFALVTGRFGVPEWGPLEFPTAFAEAADGRTFIAERFTGRIRVLRDGVLEPGPFATLPGTATAGEQGLLGLALDPAFPQSPWLYAYQTYAPPSGGLYNRIVRIAADVDTGRTLEVILAPLPASTIHNGGVIAFGTDGKLYALVGDAQSPNAAQDLRALNGKVLRLNPDGTVPEDNPFAQAPNANPYVYTYGHRNMFGIAFHPVTARAYVTENGPTEDDEINVLVPGGNYGWPVVSGVANRPAYIDPIATYTPTIAPTNAAFAPGFGGDLVFGDWKTGSLRRLRLVPPTYEAVASQEVLVIAPEGILDVDVALDGALRFTTPTTLFRYGGDVAAVGTDTINPETVVARTERPRNRYGE
jgi:quinoprotein glucose dehydrogenase